MFKRSQRHRFRYAAIAALALFIAQLGGIAHAYTHQPTVAAAVAQSQSTQSTHEFCSDCLNFAPLLAAGPSPVVFPVSLEHASGVAPTEGFSSLFAHRTYLAFRSRAPPTAH